MADVDVSIVICTHNRPALLKDALDSLVVQVSHSAFRYEVVVVHTGGSDGTQDVIAAIEQRATVPVRAIYQPHRGQVVARNRGLSEAKGDWIANFDDDQIAEPTWLFELWKIAREKSCRSVGGAMRLKLPAGYERPLTHACQRMLGASVDWKTPRLYTRTEGPGSGNQLLHRSVFDQVGVYDETYTLRGYDTDLYRRIREAGIDSWFVPTAMAYHVIPPSRMGDDYFQETSLHNGWMFARRDHDERGARFAILVMAARIGQAAVVNVPRLLKARLLHRSDAVLDARTRLWKAEGYVRSSLYSLAPRIFRQERFFSRYEFRAERRLLSTVAAAPAKLAMETSELSA